MAGKASTAVIRRELLDTRSVRSFVMDMLNDTDDSTIVSFETVSDLKSTAQARAQNRRIKHDWIRHHWCQ